ncbi:MAG: hypothetical protein ACYTGG_07550, partial [Planctomycetota bacterium]
MIDSRTPRHLPHLLLLLLSAMLASCASSAPAPTTDVAAAPAPAAMASGATSDATAPPASDRARDATTAGRIVDAPANLRRFSPTDTASGVADASTVSLRSIFEDLGEDAATWYQHVQTLSDPYFEGRAAGTKGFERATEYLGFHFDRIGLEPAFPAEATEEVASTAWTRFDQSFTYAGRPRRTYDLSGEALSFGG